MLKDFDTPLKTSSNYVETHRTVSGPDGTREYHEFRSYNTGGESDARNVSTGGDFNLERQVQHMIPLNASSTSSLDRSYPGLTSTGMVSSVQQKKTSHITTYKVHTNQYSSNGERIGTTSGTSGQLEFESERPGSRLKQNIDELDTLLSDLNNARGSGSAASGVGGSGSSHYHREHHHHHHQQHDYNPTGSSDDYSLSDTGLQVSLQCC